MRSSVKVNDITKSFEALIKGTNNRQTIQEAIGNMNTTSHSKHTAMTTTVTNHMEAVIYKYDDKLNHPEALTN